MISTTVPYYIYIPGILGMLLGWGLTALYAKKRINELRCALEMRWVLMGSDYTTKDRAMVAGDTLLLNSQNGFRLAEVSVTSGVCTLNATVHI